MLLHKTLEYFQNWSGLVYAANGICTRKVFKTESGFAAMPERRSSIVSPSGSSSRDYLKKKSRAWFDDLLAVCCGELLQHHFNASS